MDAARTRAAPFGEAPRRRVCRGYQTYSIRPAGAGRPASVGPGGGRSPARCQVWWRGRGPGPRPPPPVGKSGPQPSGQWPRVPDVAGLT
eukprot:10787934-Alexandrium_andersonii.AAC.1